MRAKERSAFAKRSTLEGATPPYERSHRSRIALPTSALKSKGKICCSGGLDAFIRFADSVHLLPQCLMAQSPMP